MNNPPFVSQVISKDLLTRPVRLRKMAAALGLSKEAKHRLEWFLWYEDHGKDATLTCRHFGIAGKTFYKWKKLFEENNLRKLEEKSRAPLHVRQPMHTNEQYARFVPIRKRYLRYGKEKLLRIYKEQYPDDTAISLWHIQRMIVRSRLYYNPKKNARTVKKRQLRQGKPRKRIATLQGQAKEGFLLCLDTVQRSSRGKTRYIYTAVDKYSKVAFAHAYTRHSSAAARDFLYRLHYLLDGRISNIQTDNGSEFEGHFALALQDLGIEHYYSRVRTPKDNGSNERFNRTLAEECLQMGNMTENLELLNRRLTDWLVEYNFHRPHQSLSDGRDNVTI